MKHLWCGLWALVGCLCFWASPVRAEPPMWVIRDQDSTIVLFGSVHVLPPGDEWRTAALMEALATTDEVWFEIPFTDVSRAEIARRVGAGALLPRGQTLSARLQPQTAERLQRVAGGLGLYMPGLERLQPWMAEVILSLAADHRAGGRPDDGVERRINAELPATVPRLAFETVAQQMDSLSGASEAGQIAALTETLREMEEDPGNFERIVANWRSGDLATLEDVALAPMRRASPEVYDRLIVRRNQLWSEAISLRLGGSGRSVMIVGVGHLIGPQGVPALLRARGIAVEGP